MGNLYIARHGETEYNRLKIFIGQKNIALNGVGFRQAHRLGEKMRECDIDLIITSTLKRAYQTTEIVKKYIKKDIVLDSRFQERCAGIYEGISQKKVIDNFQKKHGKNMEKFYNITPEEGESIFDVRKRVFEALDEIKENHQKKNILVITHSFVAKIINNYFNRSISQKNFFEFKLKNCEIKKFTF